MTDTLLFTKKESKMPKPHTPKPAYSAQFRQQMIELVQTGRNPNELAREFGCHVTSFLSWVRMARLNLPAGTASLELPLGASECLPTCGLPNVSSWPMC